MCVCVCVYIYISLASKVKTMIFSYTAYLCVFLMIFVPNNSYFF